MPAVTADTLPLPRLATLPEQPTHSECHVVAECDDAGSVR